MQLMEEEERKRREDEERKSHLEEQKKQASAKEMEAKIGTAVGGGGPQKTLRQIQQAETEKLRAEVRQKVNMKIKEII